jgi:uncharacterized protein
MRVCEGFAVKVWYDALTGKHMRYGVAIARHLRSRGHEVLLTTRRHPDTTSMAEYLGEKVVTVGQYNPKSLLTRLQSGARRQLALSKIFEKQSFDVAVSHGSADLCRVAFGLGKPVITTVDTPYADAVHKLTLPLSKYLVKSKSITDQTLSKYLVDGETVNFDSVDEVAWIKNFKPQKLEFGKPLIVVRPLEDKAVYTKKGLDMNQLTQNLTKLGTVVYLSRYQRKAVKNLVVPKGFVDSASLVAQANLFVGVGGTITREAALQGTPAIILNVFPKQEVNDLLMEKGFPIYRTEFSETQKLAEELVEKKFNVKSQLAKLENPVDTITALIEGN